MSDRLTEIRARLDAWHDMEPVEQSLTHPDEYVSDIAWLLDELQQSYWDVDEAIRKGEDAADYWKKQFDSLRRQHKEMRP